VKIACPSCSAKYSIADEKVQNRLAKIRCRKCGTTIVIDGKVSPPTVQAAGGGASVHQRAAAISHAPASQGPSATYTVDISESDQRPMTVGEIVDAYNTGVVAADTYVWQDGMPDWAPLADVPEINEALHAAAAALSQPPAAFSAAPAVAAPTFQSSRPPVFEPAAREPVRAATRAEPRADLFGSIDRAGSEQDPIGALGNADPDAGITSATTGARNESSVLFSLSALTGTESTSSARGGSSTSEDSGLIDLAALTAAAERGDAAQSMDLGASPLAGLPLGGGPLGGAPLTGGTTSPLGGDAHLIHQGSSKNGLFIGGGIAVAALVGGLVYLLKEEPPVAQAVIPTATVIVTAAAPPPPPVEKKSDEEKEESAEEKDSKPPPKAPKRRYTAPKKSAPSRGDKSSESSKSESKPAAPKPPANKSKCNCKAGDLMCAMKCSTK
jgi:predicted Zn finger-like uncharacterized protein